MKKLSFLFIGLLICSNAFAVKEYARRYPTNTAMEVYSPTNPPPGGGSSLATLSDVTLGSLSNGEVLTYVTADGKWENKPAGAASQTPWTSNIDGAGYDLSGVDSLTAASITDSALTSGRVPIVSTSGLLADDGDLTYNSTTNTLTTGTFVGALTGTASGNLVSGGALGTPSSGTATNLTGTASGLTAGAATVLANARTIGGTSFNGSANIDPLQIVPTTTPADSTGFGTIAAYTYGESITLGAPLYYKSDGKVYNADANGSSTYPVIGVALATASSGSNNVLLHGIYQFASAHSDFTVGGLVYLSITVGTLTQTQPSATDEVVQVVGVAVGADTLLVNPSADYVTHT